MGTSFQLSPMAMTSASVQPRKADEVFERGGLRAADGQDVHDREVALGVLGAVDGDFGVRPWLHADAGDLGMLREHALGLAHALDGAAEHGLDRGVVLERVLEPLDTQVM